MNLLNLSKPNIYWAIRQTFVLLDLRKSFYNNPTIFFTEIAIMFAIVGAIYDYDLGIDNIYNIQIIFWMLLLVLFGNFSEALSEAQSKAQTDSLRSGRFKVTAYKLKDAHSDKGVVVKSTDLIVGDLVLCKAGDIIPADGEVVEGIATVDESAMTGESAPVIRESGGDRSAVTGGTRILSDQIKIKITAKFGDSFLDQLIKLVENSKRRKTPTEQILNSFISAISIVIIFTAFSLKFFSAYYVRIFGEDLGFDISIVTYMTILVCLTPSTIGALANSIGISGVSRLLSKNIIALSGKAIETAGDIDSMLIDKTGTLTFGNRQASQFFSTAGVDMKRFSKVAQLASISDETPEGRSIMILAKNKYKAVQADFDKNTIKFIKFSSQNKISGADIIESGKTTKIRKGAVESIEKHIKGLGGSVPADIKKISFQIAKTGATPLLLSENEKILGVIKLKDIIKGGIKEKLNSFRRFGIRTIMVTGDNHITATAIAAETGVDDYLAEATPLDKLELIKEKQAEGHIVAMSGDGINDAPALAQADIGLAMNTGTMAAREAGNMIDLDSNPTKLLEIVAVGKEILMTRGGITTFTIASEMGKYFAIIPGILSNFLYEGNANNPLGILNIMSLNSGKSAILSTCIFNSLSVLALIPLSLGGIKHHNQNTTSLLFKNFLIYGVGGFICPFILIKLIDYLLVWLNVV